jgi:signal peptidase I
MAADPTHAAAPAPSGSAPSRAAGHRPARTVVVVLVTAALVCLLGLVRTYVAGPVRISSQSMEPTLYAGDVVLVDRRGVDVADLDRGDLVTFGDPGTGEPMLKRVVALPGDSVATIDAILHVNDRPVEEPYVDFSDWEGIFSARVVVPAGHVYVLGDNRGDSVDSREFGTVPVASVDGRVLTRLWPVVRPGGDRTQPPLD